MAINLLKALVWFLIAGACSLSCLPSIYVSSASYKSSHEDALYVSFSLTHRDAESSPLRSVEADPLDLPEGMPLRDFVAAGRALRGRLAQIKRRNPLMREQLSYGGQTVGDFILTVPVGTPSQNLSFLVDTGSQFTWTQCSPCPNCTNSTATTPPPRFNYTQSSSFRQVRCDSPYCNSNSAVASSCSITSHLCSFTVGYVDGSVDSGLFSIDSFDLGPKFSKPFIFGCAHYVRDTTGSDPSSGVMGLDPGPLSFTSQLFASNPDMPKKFAYCLPDRIKSLNAPGSIKFGNYTQPAEMWYTPIAAAPPTDSYMGYYVTFKGIEVGETMIKVDMEAHEGMKTLVDSGTALTQLVKPLYDAVVIEMMRQTVTLGPFKNEDNDLCYTAAGNATEPPAVPRMSMHFAGGVKLELEAGSILGVYRYDSDTRSTVFCLAFQATPELGIASNVANYIGNYQQQNYWVEYNLETLTVGLAKAHCAKKAKKAI